MSVAVSRARAGSATGGTSCAPTGHWRLGSSSAHQSIAWLGAAEAVFGVGSTAAKLIGYPLAIASVAGAAWVWWRTPATEEGAALRYSIAAAAVLLASPHTVFYDAGLVVLAGIVLADRATTDRDRKLLVAGFAVAYLNVISEAIWVTPVLATVVLAYVLVLQAARATARPEGRAVRST